MSLSTTLRLVQAHVLAACKQLQVVRMIVRAIAVDVVHVLRGQNRASVFLLSDDNCALHVARAHGSGMVRFHQQNTAGKHCVHAAAPPRVQFHLAAPKRLKSHTATTRGLTPSQVITIRDHIVAAIASTPPAHHAVLCRRPFDNDKLPESLPGDVFGEASTHADILPCQ